MAIRVQVAEKLAPLIVRPKPLKVAIGGRGGSKSIGFGDSFLRCCDAGERLCCGREYQNTIEDSVHALLKARIDYLGVETVHATASKIVSDAGGEIFYRGLARNTAGFKSAFGINKLWIEEAQTLSEDTIEQVLPTIREDGSEIWMSANRGASNDAFSKHFLKPYERELEKHGFYEDDDILIVEINWWDNPFFPESLNKRRLRDKRVLPTARYDHIWNGKYSDSIENAIIFPEWFDACVDAHIKLGFKPEGVEVVTHDPSDQGGDAKALAHRHGSIFLNIETKDDGDFNQGVDWALDYAIQVNADEFGWDGDGIGAGARRQVSDALDGKKISTFMFKGSESVDFPDKVYEPIDSEVKKAKTNKEIFLNKRAQYYWMLRDRCLKTFLAVTQNKYTDPGELISFSSEIKELDMLRSELCRIPRKEHGGGKIQIVSKPDMKKKPYELESPNRADVAMMSLATGFPRKKRPARKAKARPRTTNWMGA